MLKDALKKVRALVKPEPEKEDKMEILPDDVFLVSYPKSGNTWLRFLLGNIYNNLEKTVDEVNFLSVHSIIPELGQGASNCPASLPRVLKTHDSFRKDFKKVVLILRDPMDVIFSYYNYLNGEKVVKISLSEVVHHGTYGIEAVIDHTNSYIRQCEDLLIVLYEGLHEDPKGNMDKICDFLGIDAPGEAVLDAIKKSSFSSMRKVEVEKGRKFGNRNFLFTRSGKTGEGEKNIKEGDRKFIMKELKKCPVLYMLYGRAV